MYLNNKKKGNSYPQKNQNTCKKKNKLHLCGCQKAKGLRNVPCFYRFFLSIKIFRTRKKLSVVKLLLLKKSNILIVIIYKT